jgi:hypothetical protein
MKVKSPDGMIYSYPAGIRIVKKIVPGPGPRVQYYHVEKCTDWNPEVWTVLESSDYLYHAIVEAKCLAWVFCHSINDHKRMLERVK